MKICMPIQANILKLMNYIGKDHKHWAFNLNYREKQQASLVTLFLGSNIAVINE